MEGTRAAERDGGVKEAAQTDPELEQLNCGLPEYLKELIKTRIILYRCIFNK